MSQVKAKWSYTLEELGTGIKCSSCGHKLNAMTVIMGDKDLDICPFCEREMQPIDDDLLDRLKEEAYSRW